MLFILSQSERALSTHSSISLPTVRASLTSRNLVTAGKDLDENEKNTGDVVGQAVHCVSYHKVQKLSTMMYRVYKLVQYRKLY